MAVVPGSAPESASAVDRLIVGLDIDSPAEALKMAKTLQGRVGVFKIGPRLIHRAGPDWMRELCSLGKVFLDCKFHDIPSTTNSAVRTAFELGATYVTVHASVGSTALGILAQTEKVLSAQREFKVLCVTVLTSFDEGTLPKNWKTQSIEAHVQNLVAEVQAAGLKGVVCSPHELVSLQRQGLFLVAPGIRFKDGDLDDQARVMEPAQALRQGASALVVGRPIIQSSDPVAAAERILKDMESAL